MYYFHLIHYAYSKHICTYMNNTYKHWSSNTLFMLYMYTYMYMYVPNIIGIFLMYMYIKQSIAHLEMPIYMYVK